MHIFLIFFQKRTLRIIKIPNQEKHFNLKQNQNKEFLGVFFFQIFILIGMIRPYIEGPNISKKSYLFFKVLPPSFELAISVDLQVSPNCTQINVGLRISWCLGLPKCNLGRAWTKLVLCPAHSSSTPCKSLSNKYMTCSQKHAFKQLYLKSCKGLFICTIFQEGIDVFNTG